MTPPINYRTNSHGQQEQFCSKCATWLPITNFSTSPSRYNGRAYYCKKCAAALQRQYRCTEAYRQRPRPHYNKIARKHYLNTENGRRAHARAHRKQYYQRQGYVRVTDTNHIGKILDYTNGIYTIRLTHRLPNGDRIIHTRSISPI